MPDIKAGDTVKIAKSAMDFLSRRKWGGKSFTVVDVFTPPACLDGMRKPTEQWARLKGTSIWPVRMLQRVP